MAEGEQVLIRRFQAGDTKAFNDIMMLFQEKALSLAYYRTGHREDALDIVQEAFVRMYKVLPGWKPKASLFTWLYRVIVNLSVDRSREKKRGGEVPLDILPPVDSRRNHHPRAVLIGKEIGIMIERAVALLPPKQRDVFVLRQYQDLPLKEIARIQGCSVGAVKANLFLALRKLRAGLKNYYYPEEN
ncbi:MAG: RNA polymerase sigma factor [Candidatus Euphemobacter frigidus]|nr:RNA polymerase sigma factor [Candidatus Euphemobacter frigidus]MDP8274988.1 RNA polymerase sigma factor [Candidatus Euphemobacter frigidus]